MTEQFGLILSSLIITQVLFYYMFLELHMYMYSNCLFSF